MNDRLFSDEIRARERSRRRRGILWDVASVVLHVALFAAIVFLTPVKNLVFEKEKKKANPAAELPADRIEEISEALSQARVNELLQQIDDLQAVLHNMDLMKEELQKDYDAFAEQSAEDMKAELSNLLDEAERAQSDALEGQKPVKEMAEKMVAEEKKDLADENRSKWLKEASADLMIDVGEKVADAQARAANALDRMQVEAQFAGYKKTAEASEKVRDAQVEAAKMQSQAQQEASDVARDMSSYRARKEDLARHEKWLDEQRERQKKAEGEQKDAREKFAQAEKNRDAAEKNRETAKAAEKQNRDAAEKSKAEARTAREASARAEAEARGERRELDAAKKAQASKNPPADVQKRIENAEKAIAEKEQLAKSEAEKSARANEAERAYAAKANEKRRESDEQNRAFHEQRNAADREKRRAENAARTAEDAKNRIKDLEKKVAERKEALASVEKTRRERVNDGQIKKFENAAKAQSDIHARIDSLRKVLANDASVLTPLAAEGRDENELVTRDASAMTLTDAYQLACEIETAITESYKDIRATQTAIERKMGFEAAQKITDVARAVRMEADREAIEASARTKEALDAKKVAQAEIVREADGIVETAVAMMTEAMELVKPDGEADRQKAGSSRAKQVRWLKASDFASRSREGAREERLKAMSAAADYQVAISSAAAENERQRAKDMTKVMDAHRGAGSAVARGGNGPAAGASAGERSKSGGYTVGQGSFVPLVARLPGLVGGNIMRVTNASDDGLPAKWMYIKDWYVLGPFPNPDRVNLRRRFPPESVVDLDATYIGKDGATIGWKFMQAENMFPRESWMSDRRALVVPSRDAPYTIWYAYTEVFADADCDCWIAIGSDDRSDIWLNDISVWESSNKLKAWRIDEGYRRVRFQKGRNRILARIENGWHVIGWSLCIYLGDGAPPGR